MTIKLKNEKTQAVKLRPNAQSSFNKQPSKTIKVSNHSVSGSTSQTSVMILDKKLINFKDPSDGERSKGSINNQVKIINARTQVIKDRKVLSSNTNRPVKGVDVLKSHT